ncbi:hypothetical protein SC171_16555 [Pantoea cypripedii]|uniref:hypothetical protein n=1 Tax=Pantoea cypripedii TaxID=55209 RepID=UPI002FC93A9B
MLMATITFIHWFLLALRTRKIARLQRMAHNWRWLDLPRRHPHEDKADTLRKMLAEAQDKADQLFYIAPLWSVMTTAIFFLN